MNSFKMAKVFKCCAKVAKFRQIWSHCEQARSKDLAVLNMFEKSRSSGLDGSS